MTNRWTERNVEGGSPGILGIVALRKEDEGIPAQTKDFIVVQKTV